MGDKTAFVSYCGLEGLVIATPDITHCKLALGEDRYLVVASDGLLSHSVFSNEQCMQWLKQQGDNDNMQSLADSLVQAAIETRKSRDNTSAIVLKMSG